MKVFITALAALCLGQAAYADTTVGTPTQMFGWWTLKRGSTTIANGSGTQADCRARAQTDAESRHATANYTCGQTETDSFTVTYSAAPVVCQSTSPADTSATISCQSPYFGTRQITRGWTLHQTPACWVNDGPINPPADSAPPCSTMPPSGTYSTTFSLAENPLSEGGMWTNGKSVGIDWNNAQSIPGKAYGAAIATGYNDNLARLNTSFTGNQFAQGTVYRAAGYGTGGDSHEVALLLRFSITAHNAHGYEILWGRSGELNVVRWNGALASYTSFGAPGGGGYGPNIGPANDGDVVRAEVIGSTIRVYVNGVNKLTVDLTSQGGTVWTDGQPGMAFWPTGTSTPANYGWKNYQAGNLP